MRFSRLSHWFSLILALVLLIISAPNVWAAVSGLLQGSSTLTVNVSSDEPDANPGDGLCQTASGECSLRAALAEANALPGLDNIHFNLPGNSPHVILVGSPLPDVTEAVVIDGRSQPDYSDSPVVVLDGSLAGEQSSGLTITAGDSTVQGLAIHSFGYSGLYLLGGSNNQVAHNYLGTRGQLAQGNQIGLLVEGSGFNTIHDNLISGNEVGLYLYGLGTTENTVSSNYIGTDPSGTTALGNEHGIRITQADGNLIGAPATGGSNAADRNLISGNETGIYIQGEGAAGNRIWGNYIGLDVSGAIILGNEAAGVYILDAPGNLVGGPDAGPNQRGNVIAGGELGVYVRGPSSQGNLVRNNIIGTATDQTPPAERISGGVLVSEAVNNEVGGNQPGEGNLIVSQQYGIRLRGTAVGNTTMENNILDVTGDEGEDEGAGEQGSGGEEVQGSGESGEKSIASLTGTDGSGAWGQVAWKPGSKGLPLAHLTAKMGLLPQLQSGGTTFTVTVTSDGGDANVGNGICADSNGDCTLRAAIEEADATTATDTIAFNIPGSGPHTIQPGSKLPVINETIILDGTTEPDFVSTPIIELDGSNAGAGARGLQLEGASSTIRGLVINRFDDDGIFLETEAISSTIEGNYIGTNLAGTAALGNGDDGITLWNTHHVTIGGTTTAARNLIAGNAENGIAIFNDPADYNIIQGNIIGLDINGTTDLGNGWDGVYIDGGDNNSIGGIAPGAGNLISGNGHDGIELDAGSTDNSILGNLIGTDSSGTVDLGNGDRGVELDDASNNMVGGTTPAARNLISGNDDDGLAFVDSDTTGNIVQGNYIGTNISGTVAIGNSSDGVYAREGAGNNTVGGTANGAGNLISGNGDDGIDFDSNTTGMLIQGNKIGTDATGMAALANGEMGLVADGAADNTIGGTANGAGNLISGNSAHGISLRDSATTGNVMQGNLIGIAADGLTPLGNGRRGISIRYSADDNIVGGTTAAAGNTIAYNTDEGVYVDSSNTGNSIRANSIFSNTKLGIDLNPVGVTSNDSGDGDTGANNRQNFPVIISATTKSTATTITGTLNSTANLTFTLDFYGNTVCDSSGNGQGQFYLGSDTVVTDGSGDVSFTSNLTTGASDNPILTATATDPNGNSSEFSACFTAAVLPELIADFTASPIVGTVPLAVDFTNLSTNGTSYLWNFGDGTTATTTAPTHTYTQTGVYNVSLTAYGLGDEHTLVREDYITVVDPISFTLGWDITGEQAGAHYGYNARTAGDVNDDGYADVIVGASQYDNTGTDEGRAYLYYGGEMGLSLYPSWTMGGIDDHAWAGFAVNTAGDVNGDDFADVIIGARYTSGNAPGQAYVYYGSATGLKATADWTMSTNQDNDRFGHAVASAGDVNGDGYDDVIIGASQYENGGPDQGRVFVYHGSAMGLATTADWSYGSTIDNEWFGYSVNSAGDINGDGYDDVVVGSSSGDRVMVFQGSGDGLSQTPDWTFSSGQSGSHLGTGTSVSGVGDVNKDGFADVLVGAQSYTNPENREGKVWLFYGSENGLSITPDWTTESNQAQTAFGWAVGELGDVNQDGYADFLIGADEYDNSQTDAGQVYLFLGSPNGPATTAAWTAEGTESNGRFGHAVSGAGDVDGNGYPDLVIGQQNYSGGLSGQGRSLIYYASPQTQLLPTAAFQATPDSGEAAHTVTFTNTSRYATDFLWDFGDGTSSSDLHPSHTYNQAGSYTATLTATNEVGSHLSTHSIFVSPAVPDEDDLIITVADVLNSTAGISDTISLSVTVQNVGDAVFSGVVVQANGWPQFTLSEYVVGTLAANSSTSFSLPVTVLGYNTEYTSTTILAEARNDHFPYPALDEATITFAARASQTIANSSRFGLEAGDPNSILVEVLEEQIAPNQPYIGVVFGFDLTRTVSGPLTHTLDVDLSDLLVAGQAFTSTLMYEPDSTQVQTVTATYNENNTELTFTAVGPGIYRFAGTRYSGGTTLLRAAEEPQAPEYWQPGFNEPVVSLFNGSASYSHNFMVPPGPNGFQPSLGLTYNSSTGNGKRGATLAGLAGFGWQLTSHIDIVQSLSTCTKALYACQKTVDLDEDIYDQYNLTINGAGYELIHKLGKEYNSEAGRYYAQGIANLFVYYCEDSDGVIVCENEDDDSLPQNGNADSVGQESDGYWVVKTPDDTTYRLGFTANSEREIFSQYQHNSIKGANGNPALAWRVDRGRDRFGNLIEYTYEEYNINSKTAWPLDEDGWKPRLTKIHAPSSYLAQIEYGYDATPGSTEGYRITFTNGFMTRWVYGDILGTRTVSWENKYLAEMTIASRSNLTQVLRRYKPVVLTRWQHGQGQDVPQESWCGGKKPRNGQVPILVGIEEYGSAGLQMVPGRADVAFTYEFLRTGTNHGLRFCFPYMTEVHSVYGAQLDDQGQRIPAVSFDYYDNSGTPPFKYDNEHGSSRNNINVVKEKVLDGGWTAAGPTQTIYFDYDPLQQNFEGEKERFQGFEQANRCLGAACDSNYELKETTEFLIYPYDKALEVLTGKILSVTTSTWVADAVTPYELDLTQTINSWDILDDYGTATVTETVQPIITQTVTSDLVHGVQNRLDYIYDAYGNQAEVQEFGEDLTGTVPLRTQETRYINKYDSLTGVWLVGLPWRVTTWDGPANDGDSSKIVSRQRLRYDGYNCTTPFVPQPGASISNDALLTHVDSYIPGEGNGCDGDWLVTQYEYGDVANGGTGEDWQLTTVTPPSGPKTLTHWRNLTQIGSMVQKNGTTSFTSHYGYGQEGNDPWLLTTITQTNGAVSTYDYDAFGRLTDTYAPNGTNGQATIHSQQVVYQNQVTDHRPMSVAQITLPDDPTLRSQTTTFYDALARPIQTRSWGLSSDFQTVVNDIEYNALGRTACQAVARAGGVQHDYSVGLNCEEQVHSSTLYNPLGAAVATTGIDGLVDYSLTMGRTSISFNRGEQLSVATVDELGRLARVEEFPVTYDAFASGEFDLNSGNWSYDNNIDPTIFETEDGVSAVRLVGVPDLVHGNGWTGEIARNNGFNLDLAEGGQGAIFRFQLADTNHGGGIHLQDEDGRFTGFIFWQGDIYPYYNDGTNPNDDELEELAITQMVGYWYLAQLSIDQEGRLSWHLWREDAPDDLSQQINVTAYEDSGVMSEFIDQKFRGMIKTGAYTPDPNNPPPDSIMYLADYSEGPVYTTRYEYDLQDNLTTVTDTLGYTTVITYDTLSRKRAMNDPDMGVWDYDYDFSGNLIRQTDGNGDKLCFYYDGFNRLTEKSHEGTGTGNCPANPTTANVLAEYTYHGSGPGLGQLKTLSGAGDGTHGAYEDTFTYDYRGRVTNQVREIDGRFYDMTVANFDDIDRPTMVNYDYHPLGATDESVLMTYDRQFEEGLAIQGIPPKALVNSLTHNLRGQLTRLNRPGDVQDTQYTYYGAAKDAADGLPGAGNSSYRLRYAHTGEEVDVQRTAVDLMHFSYDYDVVGNISAIYLLDNDYAVDWQHFSYDHLNRLQTGLGGNSDGCASGLCYDHTHVYSATGNIANINRAGQVSEYDYANWHANCTSPPAQALPHAVKQIGANDYYCYDGNGNMIKRHDGSGDYLQEFDVENRLVKVTDTSSNEVTQFYYDANGQRLLTVEPDGTKIYYPFPGYEEEVDGTTTIQRSTYFLAGQAIATRISGDPDADRNGLFFIHSDHLGSASVMSYGAGHNSGTTGAMVPGSLSRYLPFGDWRAEPTADLTDIGFTGHKSNNVGSNDIGLIYMNARFYVPYIYRMLTPDSIVPDPTNPQSYNRYSYVNNRPLNFTDPSGHVLEAGCETEGCAGYDDFFGFPGFPLVPKEFLDALDEAWRQECIAQGASCLPNRKFRFFGIPSTDAHWGELIAKKADELCNVGDGACTLKEVSIHLNVMTFGTVSIAKAAGIGLKRGFQAAIRWSGTLFSVGAALASENPEESMVAPVIGTAVREIGVGLKSPPLAGVASAGAILYSIGKYPETAEQYLKEARNLVVSEVAVAEQAFRSAHFSTIDQPGHLNPARLGPVSTPQTGPWNPNYGPNTHWQSTFYGN